MTKPARAVGMSSTAPMALPAETDTAHVRIVTMLRARALRNVQLFSPSESLESVTP